MFLFSSFLPQIILAAAAISTGITLWASDSSTSNVDLATATKVDLATATLAKELGISPEDLARVPLEDIYDAEPPALDLAPSYDAACIDAIKEAIDQLPGAQLPKSYLVYVGIIACQKTRKGKEPLVLTFSQWASIMPQRFQSGGLPIHLVYEATSSFPVLRQFIFSYETEPKA